MSPEQIQIAIMIAIGVLILAIVIWLLMRANRKTTVIGDEMQGKDVLDDGASPAERNQALIDAPRTVDTPVPAPAPIPEPVPVPAPAASGGADDLRKIKGVGPKLVTMLAEQGITTFAQVAAWTPADIEKIDARLGRFAGRITRDQWVDQAKLLVGGDETAFSEKFGNNG